MGLRRRITRLTREAEEGAVLVKLRDGSIRAFDAMTVAKEMFLTGVDLACDRPIKHSDVLEAVRRATPESRAAFEAEHGSITPETCIIASPERGGWVRVHKLLEDGRVETTFHEGDSEEARRLREEARQQGPAFG